MFYVYGDHRYLHSFPPRRSSDLNADGPHNFGWQGIGGTIFIVDPNKDFFMIYMEQKRGGPRGSQFNNNVAQQVIYSAMSE